MQSEITANRVLLIVTVFMAAFVLACGAAPQETLTTSVQQVLPADNEVVRVDDAPAIFDDSSKAATGATTESSFGSDVPGGDDATGASDSFKPNILLIMADDFNHWLGAGGYYPHVKTPNLDRLASEGVYFDQAMASSPACNPSRTAMWSGLRPVTSGITSNDHGYFRDEPALANVVTMNQFFKENGYYVYGAGKLYHSMRMGGPTTDAANWSAIDETRSGCRGAKLKHFTSITWPNFRYGRLALSPWSKACDDIRLARRTAKLIREYPTSSQKDKPFFVALGLFRPHLPWNTPKAYWQQFNRNELTIPPGFRTGDLADVNRTPNPLQKELVTADRWMEAIQAYLAALALADANVGIVLEALAASGQAENTIVLFMGDHGWHLGEKEWWGKKTPYDAANRTTLIIRDPRSAGNGGVSSQPVSLQDIYPTLVSLTGLSVPATVEGHDLSPLLANPLDPSWDYPNLMTYRDTNYVRTLEWKFIERQEQSELYHITDDPYEWTNLYGDATYDGVVLELRDTIAAELADSAEVRDVITANNYGAANAAKKRRRKKQPKPTYYPAGTDGTLF